MGLFSSIDISGSGLSAQRLRMDVISNNIANVNTTRTENGEVFRRSQVILRPRNDERVYKSPFLPERLKTGPGNGVKVSEIKEDTSQLRLVYDPDHPDSIKSGPKKGYVEYPNVNIVTEMVDMISATRAYEANISSIQNSKSMFNKALEIGK
ncbi:MAG: flagellar basal body rod protein FlgC [Spirochaetes bacterium GWD1_27_9]|nr:MAG: flagellar basal body rod protein FlgC [Spirochaetes bacterium GWC1_27_15]OHD31127.1 MAG: flagellar basal body rod protein FlgC [Spirochaetes bacterium GWD1_27_9]